MPTAKHDNETRMTVRMPSDLYEWLKLNADKDRRSLNSQVVEILDAYRRSQQATEQSQSE